MMYVQDDVHAGNKDFVQLTKISIVHVLGNATGCLLRS